MNGNKVCKPNFIKTILKKRGIFIWQVIIKERMALIA